MNYDNCTCDRCGLEMNEKDAQEAMGYMKNKLELVCISCSDKLIYCDCCGRVGDDMCFSYGSERCDSCCDRAVDRFMDRD